MPDWLPNGQRRGHEWVVGSIAGEAGDSCSINLNTGQWADFAGDDRGGDLVSLYAAVHRCTQIEAARAIAAQLGIDVETSTPTQRKKTAGAAEANDGWRDAGPWPPDGPPPPQAHPYRGAPQLTWAYLDEDGRVLGYACRFVTSTGEKDIIPLTWSKHPERGLAWKWRQFDAPRPLYNVPAIARHPDRPVLVVEGEKCAQLAQQVLGDDYVVTTWPGGCKAWQRASWPLLAGRDVVVWPDCDAKRDKHAKELLPEEKQPGMRAAEGIAQALLALSPPARVRIVKIPAPGERPDGFDVADVIEAAGGSASDRARRKVLACLAPGLLRLPRTVGEKTPSGAARARGGEAAGHGGRGVGPPGGGDGPIDLPEPRWTDQLIYERGKLLRHAANITTILRHDERWRGVLAYDEFGQQIVKRTPPPYAYGRAGVWEEEDDTRTAVWLAQHYVLDVAPRSVTEAVEMVAMESRFHPVREYLRTLTWDGERRAEEWLVRYCSAPDTPFVRLAGLFFLRGMVRRVMEPGCKFDYCLVLEGDEGLRKSSLAAILGGAWGSDAPLDLANNREASLNIAGTWVHEFAEMESVTRAEGHLQKSFLSRTFDHYRPQYKRQYIRAPRQCVFVGTVNPDDTGYIKDSQGARRFWPIPINAEIDTEGLRKVLPQLLAEAVADYDVGERYYPTRDEQLEIFTPEQRKRVRQESLVDLIHDWVLEPPIDEAARRASQGGLFSLADVAVHCLKISPAQITRDLETRIGVALGRKGLGCIRVEKRNGMSRFWYKAPPRKDEAQKAPSSMSAQPAQQPEEDDPLPF